MKHKRTAKEEQDHDVKYWWKLPYRWNLKNALKDIWNPKEKRLFPPKQFGIGWGLNFHTVWRKLEKYSRGK